MFKNLKITLFTLLISQVILAESLELLPLPYKATSMTKVESLGNKTKVSFNLKSIDFKEIILDSESYAKIDGKTSYITGAPKIPFVSIIVKGKANDISLKGLKLGQSIIAENFVPAPAPKELCRCSDDARKVLKVNIEKYGQDIITLESMGDFRGTPLTKVTLYPALVNLKQRATTFYPQVSLTLNAPIFNLKKDLSKESTLNNNYLIVYPEKLENSVVKFSNWKKSNGFKVSLKKFEEIGTTANELKDFFKNEYVLTKYNYAVIVGTEELIPMHFVDTAFNPQTPSDQPNFLFGSSEDYIPDVFAGRIVASTNKDVLNQLSKFKAYQDELYPVGLKNAIGIASNEGSDPSDEDYIRSIEKTFSKAYGLSFTHFAENDESSNPLIINETFNKGANWLTYMGHGSGSSWSSTHITYSAEDIKDIRNSEVTKPVFIDVACQNGNLNTGKAGERLMNEVDPSNNSIGTTLYYGGSVNISWHPPAIMAKGMAFNTVKKELTNISEIVFAGQLYLAENYNGDEELVDNFEWYHLFGDPSLEIKF